MSGKRRISSRRRPYYDTVDLATAVRTVLEGPSFRPRARCHEPSPQPPASPTPRSSAPRISIVIPVYNEEAILHAAVVDLRERLEPMGWTYEIILAENGSKDRTVEIGQELAAQVRRAERRSGEDHQHRRAELRQGAEAGHPARARRRSSSATRSTSATSTSTAAPSRSSRPARPTWSSARSSSPAPRTIGPAIRHAASIAYSTMLSCCSASAAPTRTASRRSAASRCSTSSAPASSTRTSSRASSSSAPTAAASARARSRSASSRSARRRSTSSSASRTC